MSEPQYKPGDVVALIDSDGRVELVRVSKCNSARVVSHLIPGRTKPIATPKSVEAVTISEFPVAASRLYEAGERDYEDVEGARRAVRLESEVADL